MNCNHGLFNPTGVNSSYELDSAIISPAQSPRILDEPVVSSILRAVANNGHGMPCIINILERFAYVPLYYAEQPKERAPSLHLNVSVHLCSKSIVKRKQLHLFAVTSWDEDTFNVFLI